MPIADHKKSASRLPAIAPVSSKTRRSSPSRAAETRRLFDKQLIQISLRLPQTTTHMAELAFEVPVREFMANAIVSNALLAELLKHPTAAEDGVRRPTPRLRRAIANAEKIGRGRFANVEDLFDALDKEAKA